MLNKKGERVEPSGTPYLRRLGHRERRKPIAIQYQLLLICIDSPEGYHSWWTWKLLRNQAKPSQDSCTTPIPASSEVINKHDQYYLNSMFQLTTSSTSFPRKGRLKIRWKLRRTVGFSNGFLRRLYMKLIQPDWWQSLCVHSESETTWLSCLRLMMRGIWFKIVQANLYIKFYFRILAILVVGISCLLYFWQVSEMKPHQTQLSNGKTVVYLLSNTDKIPRICQW